MLIDLRKTTITIIGLEFAPLYLFCRKNARRKKRAHYLTYLKWSRGLIYSNLHHKGRAKYFPLAEKGGMQWLLCNSLEDPAYLAELLYRVCSKSKA